jgi:DNA-binding CsgD family transcriptional regulator
MSRRSTNKPHNAPKGDPLTKRELQILALAAVGETTPSISKRLAITDNTVKTHLTSVYRKTGSRNRVQAARHFSENFALPVDNRRRKAPPEGQGSMSLIRDQIRALQDRLDHIGPTVSEAERLRTTLEALRAIKLD